MKYSGYNRYRQFGQDISDTALTSCKWTDYTPTHIAFGEEHALYLVNQSVFVAGRNNNGQCGIDNNKQSIANITKLTLHHPIKAVFSNHASFHSFILTTNNELYAFGRNNKGQLGVRGNNNTDITIPTKSDIGMNIKCIATGWNYSIALSIDGDVLSTGYSEYGGNGHKTTQKTAWTKISGFKVQIAQIAVGSHHSLFRDKEGVVLCCGRNDEGQLGIGIKDDDEHCSPFVIDALKTNVIDIAAGGDHSICLLDNGAVYTFGSNQYGQCGHDEELKCILSPTKVKGLNDIMKVKAGDSHTAAIKTNGSTEIYMFGYNGHGECIAEREKKKIYAPLAISAVVKNEPGKYVNDIHLGNAYSCVITVDEMKETKEETQNKYYRNLDDEIMSLKRQITEIKDRNRKYEEDLERVKNETETQKADIASLKRMKTEDENAHKLETQRMQNEIERQLSEMKDRNRKYEDESKRAKRLEEDNAEIIRNLETDKQSLTDTNSGLKNDNKENTVSTLEDERKEYDMEINELKQENKRLKLENINTDDCENWSVEEIVYWIVSLDADIYGEYEEILMKTLKEEQVNGECLSDVDINISDIKRWGIKNLKKSKRLLKEIKSLFQNKGKKKRIPELNEGANLPTAYI